MKSANMAPVYVALYPEWAEIARKHGYALSIHGSVARDFDLVFVPWADKVSTPDQVIDELLKEFAAIRTGGLTEMAHGRLCQTIAITCFGECFVDASFVLSATPSPAPEGDVEAVARAIYEASDPWSAALEWPELHDGNGTPEDYRQVARAAISAMRPTETHVRGMTAGSDADATLLAELIEALDKPDMKPDREYAQDYLYANRRYIAATIRRLLAVRPTNQEPPNDR